MKDFDYCEKCEETKDHPYAFIKIKPGEKAPAIMITAVDDANTFVVPGSKYPPPSEEQMRRQLGLFNTDQPPHWNSDQPPSMPIQNMDNKEAWNAWSQQMKDWGLRMQQ